ncbi:hypothetical protein [Roseivivax isoporae]|uniref:Uncharacterized protein n=1 Tax=Roseivivax isoporae LMG 25204 TaxID=1449351 RepID=X7F546_9RHOB|nr:hypothetical protein [Roseivivax isoporae]ETX27216.1 hypothetical protein RISW2_14950 [Roseivivax isoporae LMG 25204]
MRRSYGFFGRGDRSRWQAAFEAELDRLTVRAGGDIGRGWRRFLRTGRARFHGGQAASYKTQVAILDSRLAWQAAEARPDVGGDFQFCHDVLHALAPDLLEVPFDSAAKALSADARDHLTTLGPLSPGPGKVFGTFPEHTTTDATETTRGAAVRDLLAEIDKGWHELPPGRLNLFWNWHYWRIRRRLARDQVPHPVALRHLHPAWLLIRLKELGVELAQ